MDNLEKEEKDRFTIVVKKVNAALEGSRWLKLEENNTYSLNNEAKLREYIKGFKNAPILQIDGKTEREMTIDDLLGDKFPALFQIVADLNEFILKLDRKGEMETKKS